jgi:hypothetical protein
MKNLLLILVAASGLHAQTMYLRTIGTPYTTVVGASNATPIVLSVADASSLSNGDIICVTEVAGNFAANGHAKAEGETRHMARIVAGKVGNSFQLNDLTGAPVAGSGTYTGGGRVGRCTGYTPPATFGVWLDGPAGPMTASLSNTSGRKNASNPYYTVLQSASALLEGQTASWGRMWEANQGEAGSWVIAGALRGHVDARAASTNAALYDMRNIDQLNGTTAIDQRMAGATGAPNSTIDDYVPQLAGQLGTAYSILRGSLTVGERDFYNGYQFNDKPWSIGGTDFTGSAYTEPTWVFNMASQYVADFSHGTIQITGTNVVGSGTSFLTDLAVGSIIYAPHPYAENNATSPIKVVAVADDTHATIGFPRSVPAGSHYAVAPAWNSTHLGLTHWSGRFIYDWNHGGADLRHPGSFLADEPTQNLTIVRFLGHFGRGVASCVDTMRACLVAQRSYNAWYDLSLPLQLMLQTQGGFNASSVGYNSWRVNSAHLEMMRIAKASFGLDLCAVTGTFCEDGAKFVLALANPGPGRAFLPWAEYSSVPFFWVDQTVRPAFQSAALLPASNPSVKGFFDVFFNRMTASFAGRYAWWAYMGYDPATVPAPPPNTIIGNVGYAAQCIANWGAAACAGGAPSHPAGSIPVRWAATSRAGYAATDTAIVVDGVGASCVDHCYQASGGHATAVRNGKGLLAGGDDAHWYPAPNRADAASYIHINSDANMKVWNTYDLAFNTVPWSFGGDGYLAWRSVLTDSYKAAANASLVERQWFSRLVSGGNSYIIQHDYATLSAPGTPYAYLHVPLNGVGTPSSSSAFTVSRAARTISTDYGTAGANFSVIPFGGDTPKLDTHNASDLNFGYPSQRGHTARFKICLDSGGSCASSATSAEWATVVQTNAGGGVAMPTIATQTVSAHRIIEIRDAANPFVAAFTRGGAAAGSLAFTSSHAGSAKYIISGLNAGTYNVTVGGTPVAGSPFTAAANARGISFDSTAGNINIAGGPSALDITTTEAFGAVPSGTVGTPYSVQFTATGGTSPYSLSLFSGTLPPGLTLSAGLLSGTPTTAGTYNFRISVTDAQPASLDEPFSITIASGGGPPVINRVVFRGRRRGGVWK